MRLIDIDAFRKDYGMAENCVGCERDAKECNYDRIYTAMDFCTWLDCAPIVNQWIPVSEMLPKYDETSEYLVTDKDGRIRHCCLDPYRPETFVTVEEGMIVDAVAWRPAPEPYCKTESHEREVE